MGSCFSGSKSDGSEEEQFKAGGKKDLSNGPLLERSCTDILCVFIFIAHFLLFFAITFMGFADGDPRKLYRPRDHMGGYCGMGPDFASYDKLAQLMNVQTMVDPVAMQIMCSSVASSELQGILNSSEYLDYQCKCCLIPCTTCDGSLGYPDISDSSALQTLVPGSMSRFTNLSNGMALFGTADSSYTPVDRDAIFGDIPTYFTAGCFLDSCAMPNSTEVAGITRDYKYTPDADHPLFSVWNVLTTDAQVSSTVRSTLNASFWFTAMPTSYCPYSEKYCVPMPGVNFTEAPNDYCIPKLDSGVAGALGSAAVEVLEGLGSGSITETTSSGIGGMVGQVWATLDALFIVTFWAFMVGLLFMVLLRFFVGCFVWSALGLVFASLVGGGLMAYIRSEQCLGASLLDSGKQSAMAVTVAAASAASAAVSGTDACTESMSDNGFDYRGCQTRTVSGYLCQDWDVQDPHSHVWTPANYPDGDLTKNYCRNPNNASTIWCVTTNVDKRWESCSPVGVIQPDCAEGYMVQTEYARQALKICAYVVWGFALLWLLICICMYSRIRLAIAINKVAAQFIYHHPVILTVPMVQIGCAIIYSLLWAASASFLISQVPSGYVSTGSFATYEEAMGTETQPGECNPKWPQGFAYKDECLGNATDTAVAKCYKCAPPRYVFDAAFGFSFFSYLWNNALLVAMGQCIIAAAVGVWFFTHNDEKGKRSPVWTAVKLILRYHMGSLIFGAFIIAVVQFIRACLKYLEKQASAQKNRVMVLVLKGLQCCMWCFEKCMKFLNKNAYIQIALLGTNFCTSAKNAFFLILRNAARFSTMLILGSIIRFIGTSTIIVATTLIGYFILQSLHPQASPSVPVMTYFAMSYVVAKLFMNVFGLAVDTALQCFIAAEEQKLDKDCVPAPLRNLVNGKATPTKAKKVAPASPSAGDEK